MKHNENAQYVQKEFIGGNGLQRTIYFNKYLIIINEDGKVEKHYTNHKYLSGVLKQEVKIVFKYNTKCLLIIDGELYECNSYKLTDDISINKLFNLIPTELEEKYVDRLELEDIYDKGENEIRYCFSLDGEEITTGIPTEKEIVQLVQSKLYKEMEFIKENPDCRVDKKLYEFMDKSIENMTISEVPKNTKFIKDNLFVIKVKNGIIKPLLVSCEFIDKNTYNVKFTHFEEPIRTKDVEKTKAKVRSLRGNHAI